MGQSQMPTELSPSRSVLLAPAYTPVVKRTEKASKITNLKYKNKVEQTFEKGNIVRLARASRTWQQ